MKISSAPRRSAVITASALFAAAGVASAFGLAAHAQSTWVPGSGNWSTPGNWAPAGVPSGVAAVVRIDNAPAVASSVTQDISLTLGSLTLDTGDAVTLNPSLSVTWNNGTAASTFVNNGLYTVNSSCTITLTRPLNISGSGTLRLGGNGSAVITWAATGLERLVNGPAHTIAGAGNVGNDRMPITNDGLIVADATGLTLALRPSGAAMINNGVLRATGGGTLLFNAGTPITNTTGTINAAASGIVNVAAATPITGGTLSNVGGGLFTLTNARLTGVSIPLGSTLTVPDSGTAQFRGTITNNGTILVNSTGAPVATVNTDVPLTLTGAGTLRMLNNSIFNWSGFGTESLTNTATHTISGQGNLGNGTVAITNAGTIRADINAGTLAVRPNTAGLTNNGTIRATGGGIIVFDNGNTVTNTNGIITADSTSLVRLSGNVRVLGGTLGSSGTGSVDAVGPARIENVAIPAGSIINAQNGAQLRLLNTITNNGTISINSGAGGGSVTAGSAVTLAGSGVLRMPSANSLVNWIGSGTESLTNSATHTISGQGNLGNGTVPITNAGTIRADINAGTLAVRPNTAGLTNNGTIRATGGGIIRLDQGVTNNSSGLITADNASRVDVVFARITSGTMSTTGSGAIVFASSGIASGVLFAAGSNVSVAPTSGMQIETGITNNTDIAVPGNASIGIRNPVTIAGSGSITLQPGAILTWIGNGTETITNGPNHTIRGGRFFGGRGVTNNGSLIVTRPDNSTGIFDIAGTFTQTSTGNLQVALLNTTAGSGHDRLTAATTSTLAGRLTVTKLPGMNETPGTVYTVLTSGTSRTGTFTALTLPTLTAPRILRIVYNGRNVEARVAPCPADFNGDVATDINDFFAYLAAFAGNDPQADVNSDGNIDINDFFSYLTIYGQGC